MRAMYIIFKIFKKKKKKQKNYKKKVKITQNIRVSKREMWNIGEHNLFCCDLECMIIKETEQQGIKYLKYCLII